MSDKKKKSKLQNFGEQALIVLFGLFVILIINATSDDEEIPREVKTEEITTAVAQPAPQKKQSFAFTKQNLEAALSAIKSEKQVKDAAWTSRGVLKVGVFNDGTNRDGYAKYICQVLYDYKFKGEGVLVRVIDIVKLVNKDKWVNIGTARCQ